MQEDEVLKIAIAETSMIVRSGLALVLKRIQGLKILPIELVSEESLDECVRFHKPEILIVNPSFTGYFDVRKFKETPQNAGVKCIALMCSVADQGVLRNYDESLTIYDDADTIREKLNRLLNVPGEETEEELAGQEVLSSREKEIITCVVKGMTNKEIADALYLSAHTVITHRRNIARKLQIHSPAGLTIYAIVNNWWSCRISKNICNKKSRKQSGIFYYLISIVRPFFSSGITVCFGISMVNTPCSILA